MIRFERKDLVLMVPFIAIILGLFIHENAHVMVANNLGIRIDNITISVLGSFNIWLDKFDVSVTTIGALAMLGLSGGLMEGVFYAMLTLRVREMSVMTLGILTYGVAEAFKMALSSPDFIMFEFARWFKIFTMLATVLFIGRRLHREWFITEDSKNE